MTQKKDHPFKQSNMPLPMKVFFSTTTLVFKVLGTVSPKLAGGLALKLFMKPPNVAPPRRESKIREEAQLSYRKINDKDIAVRVWENSNTPKDAPTILLSHGWAGRTSQFLGLIEPLLAEGYRVIGADMPSHGDSSGKYTNILEATTVLARISEEIGPIEAIVGHSFGTGTILLGMDKFNIQTPKVVLIGSYSRVSFVIDLFSETFDLNQKTKDAMQQIGLDKYADTFGIEWDWENIAPVETIKSYDGKLLFIHDETDHEVPMHEVIELHQSKPDAEIMITSGLGHRRILRDKKVAENIVEFIKTP